MVKITFTKEEIVKLRPPTEPTDKPASITQLYPSITMTGTGVAGPSGGSGGAAKQVAIAGGWSRAAPSGGGGGGGGAKSHTPDAKHHEKEKEQGWARTKLPDPTPQQLAAAQQQSQGGGRGEGGGGGGERRSKQAPLIKPKKEITDPVEKIAQEVRAILNKITPQTFEKLTGKLCELNIGTEMELDKLIQLVFDKAVAEPSFSHLYANMSASLEASSRRWAFLQIVHMTDTDEWTWMKDIVFDNVLAGPYANEDECIAAASSQTPPTMSAQENVKVAISQVLVKGNVLIKVFNHTDSTAFYVSFENYESVDNELKSTKAFQSRDEAEKDALKRNSFKRRLVIRCQDEFEHAVGRDEAYGELENMKKDRDAKVKAGGLTNDERAALEAEIEEKSSTLKKRMLGNVRFIGELFKKSLLLPSIMHQCIMVLIGTTDEEGRFVGFKDDPPPTGYGQPQNEYDLDMLSRLLRTVGKNLDQDPHPQRKIYFNWWMDKILEISQDKRYSSRLRFTLEEVLELRHNQWNERREQDGPATIQEIHAKQAEEEANKAAGITNAPGPSRYLASQQIQAQGKTILKKGGPQDARGGSSGAKGGKQPASAEKGKSGGQQQQQQQKKGSSSPVPNLQKQSSGGGGGGGGKATPSSSATPSSAPVSPQPASSSSAGSVMKEEDLIKRANGLVEEYLSHGDIEETNVVLNDMPSSVLCFLVSKVLNKYIDSSKPAEQAKLLDLIKKLKDQLSSNTSEVEKAIVQFDPLKLLPDTVVDCRNAIEYLASVIGVLVSIGACRLDWVIGRIPTFKSDFIEEMAIDEPAEVEQVFDKFANALSAKCSSA